MALISVIIPIYNAEHTIKRAVESVLNQTMNDLEIILIDDGSTDGSGVVCDNYAIQYENIKVIHKKNGGISIARNAGLDAATSEYIAFLDADDYFTEDAFKRIQKSIEDYKPDCICFGLQYIINNVVQGNQIPELPKNEVLDKSFIHQSILPPLLNLTKDRRNFIFDFVWNKVFRRNLISNNNIKFDETRRIWEDRPFVVEYLKYCDRFYCLDGYYYNYVSTEGSLSSKFYFNMFDIVLENYNNYVRWYEGEYDFNNQYSINYWCRAIEGIVFRSLKQNDNQKTICEKIIQTFEKEQVIFWYKNRKPIDKFESKSSKLVISKRYDEAILLYKKWLVKKDRIPFPQKIKEKIRSVIK